MEGSEMTDRLLPSFPNGGWYNGMYYKSFTVNGEKKMDMPREIWAKTSLNIQGLRNNDWQIEPSAFDDKLVKYLRADLVENVDDEAVREAVECCHNVIGTKGRTPYTQEQFFTSVQTLITHATRQADDKSVKIPTEIGEAKLMVLLGMNFLEQNAPDQIRKSKDVEVLKGCAKAMKGAIDWMHMKKKTMPLDDLEKQLSALNSIIEGE
jgi:hypothetical protein